MTSGNDLSVDHGDAAASVRTGRRDQWLNADGWIASHADSGTPGPHVRLNTNDRRDAVLKTSQVPGFIAALTRVAERIDQQWAEGIGDYEFGPDHNDPAVIRQERIEELEFIDRVHARFPEVSALLLAAEGIEAVQDSIAELLGVDVSEASRLGQVPLWAFTRRSAGLRAETLRALLAG